MITLSHKVRIFAASDPVNFRKGHDGLAALVQSHLHQKPFDESVYVFRAKRVDRLKLIYWDGSGLTPLGTFPTEIPCWTMDGV